jgi:serine phosphatase RsbU (regulator of sigma subunit)
MRLRRELEDGGRPAAANEDDVDRLLLAFEELVSNGLRHGGSPVRAAVTTGATGWLLEVSDAAGDQPPSPAIDRDASLGGLGLYLVAQICGAHGWAAQNDGRKVVWARVDFTGQSAEAGQPTPRLLAAPPPADAGRARGFAAAPRRLSVLVAAVVLALSLVLAYLASAVNANNNQRLLQQQVEQTGALLSTQLAVLQTQMADAGQVADATHGAPGPFTRFAGATVNAPGLSLSLWRVTDAGVQRLAVHGPTPLLPPGGADEFFHGVKPTGALTVAGILNGPSPRLAYALMPAGEKAGLVVYAEAPITRRVSVPAGAAFSGFDLAVYLGKTVSDDQLVQSTALTPIRGKTASIQVPFGNTVFTVVAASRSGLTGPLSAALPWIVFSIGVLLALAGGVTVELLSRRRAVAERLAAANQRLYQEQRSIAGTLQHALLPELPQLQGVEASARYVAGADELEVGGDWYDVIPRPAGRCVFVVGDISGQGLRAATTMAELRFSVRAYLTQGDDIATVLTKLRRLLDIEVDHQFATVLLGEVDSHAGRIRVVSAGHFWPLLISGGSAAFLEGPVAPPVGVSTDAPPVVVETRVSGPVTLLAFTDGAMERRGEVIDTGLERLRSTAVAASGQPLPAVLDRVMQTSVAGGRDDTVILGLRWRS